MVYRAFWHLCCPHLSGLQRTHRSEPVCEHCGQEGIPDGWGLSLVEKQCRFNKAWGLSPFKPHHGPFQVLRHLASDCPQCAGTGHRGTHERHLDCPMCNGTGILWDATDDEIARAYEEVQAEWPKASCRVPEIHRYDD